MACPSVPARDMMTLDAVALTIGEGRILHVTAERLTAKRSPRRDAMPACSFTVGLDARGGFLVVDYSRLPSGEEERHETAEIATRAARKLVGWDRMPAFRAALRAIYGEPEKVESLCVEDARIAATGARLLRDFGHRRPVISALFGGCGQKPWI